MAMNTPRVDVQKITVTLPRALLHRLDEHVAPRSRGRFIAEAIEERLALEEQSAALEEAAGAWSHENHPDLETEAEIDGWLADLRGTWARSEASDRG